jgi:hypothetical protein
MRNVVQPGERSRRKAAASERKKEASLITDE